MRHEELEYYLHKDVSYWIPQAHSLTYAIGGPGRFPSEFPQYLPTEYLNLAEKQLIMETKSLMGGVSLLPSYFDGLSKEGGTSLDSMQWQLQLNHLMENQPELISGDTKSPHSQSETVSTADAQEGEEHHEVFVT